MSPDLTIEERATITRFVRDAYLATYTDDPHAHARGLHSALYDAATEITPELFDATGTPTDDLGAVLLPRRAQEER